MKNFIKTTITTILCMSMLSTTVFADSKSLDKNDVKALYYHNEDVINEGGQEFLYTYEKDGVLFYRLRDVASLLNYFGYKNNIIWNNNGIAVDFDSEYEATGTEFLDFKNQPLTVIPMETTLYIDGTEYGVDSLNINGSNFYTADIISELYQISLLYNEKLDFNVIYLLEYMSDTQYGISQTSQFNTEKKDKLPKDVLLQFSDLKEGETLATLKTNYGDITVKFLPEYAPKAVENFITLSLQDYYDGVIFHRVIEDFIIQSGDPTGTGYGGESIWSESFENETNSYARHFKGALAMANAGIDTNGSQFYIVPTLSEKTTKVLREDLEEVENNKEFLESSFLDPYLSPIVMNELFPQVVLDKYKEVSGLPELDFYYTVFGQVVEGQDVVDAISKVDVDSKDSHPLTDVIIEDVIIFQYKK